MRPVARRLASLFLAAWPALGLAQEQVFDFGDLTRCGLNTRFAGNRRPAECFQELVNVSLDDDLTVSRRLGQSRYNATACADAGSVRGLWPFRATDGTRYLVILSSRSIFQTSGSGDCVLLSANIGSLSATAEMQCVQALGRLWCLNGTDTGFSWDGASSAAISGMPLGTLIGTFRNRLVVANVSGALTRIRLSGELDGTDWTVQVPGRSSTPANIDLSGLNDGNPVTCLMGEYQNAYLIGREHELFALYGNDRRDFVLRKISDQVGCIAPRSVQEKDNSFFWLSRRGVEKLTGTSILRVSDPIRPSLEEIILAAGNSQARSLTTQADWDAGLARRDASGPGAPMSTAISPGNVVPSTWTDSDTTDANFNSGTRSSTTVDAGDLILSSTTNLGFETPGPTATFGWTGNFSTQTRSQYSGVGFGNVEATWNTRIGQGADINCVLTVWNADTGATVKSTTTADACGPNNPSMDLSTFTGISRIYLQFSLQDYPTWFATSSTFSFYASSFSYAFTRECSLAPVICSFGFDWENDSIYWSSGVFTSRVFNTSLSTPTWGLFEASMSSGGASGGVTFEVQSSTDPDDTFQAVVAQGVGVEIAAAQRQYLRYVATMTTTVSTRTPRISDITLLARTTGYYITDCANPGSAITSWGNLRANFQNVGGDFTFWVATGTTCSAVTLTSASWQSQTINAPIAVATATFIAARILFDMDVGTEAPALNDMTFEWNAGGNRVPAASVVFRDRYYLFFTTSTAAGAVNDHAFLIDENNKWSLRDGVNAYSAAVFNNRLYTGDSNATGRIYQHDIGQDDAGAAFLMRFKTADVDMGSPERLKVFRNLYVVLRSETEPTQDIPVVFRYYVDGSTVPRALGTVNLDEADEPGYFTAKLPFPLTEVVEGRWIAIEGEYFGNQGPLKVYSMRLTYSQREPD